MSHGELPVIIFRGNDICFLGVMRSCAEAGIPFKTVTFTWPTAKPWWSEASKYFTRDYTINNPYSDPEDALNDLIGVGKELLSVYKKPLLAIPSSDTNLMFLLDNERVLSPYFVMMGAANFEDYRNDVAHKFQCFELLQHSKENVTPITLRCSNKSDMASLLPKVEYPVVYKPATKDYGQSFYLKYQGLKAVECKNRDELEKGLHECIEHDFDVIVQEKIIFDKVEDEIPFYAYVDAEHNIRMAATGIKELIQPYPFGTANILRLTWHPELLRVANDVVKSLKWRGIIMIEFIRDKKDDKWKVIEINVRPWLFIGFYARFKLNFVSMLYRDWCGKLDKFNGQVITPSPETLKFSPLHIDLNGIAQYSSEVEVKEIFSQKTDSLSTWLQSYGNCLTNTYYDHADIQPGEASIEGLSRSTHCSKDVLFKQFFNLLYEISPDVGYTCLENPETEIIS